MRIVAPYAYFEPEQAASSYIWKNLHEAFAEVGLDCDVFVPIPTRGISTEIRDEYANKLLEEQFEGKLKIHRFPLMQEGKNPILRFFRYLLQCNKEYRLITKTSESYVALFAASTPPIWGYCCAKIRERP